MPEIELPGLIGTNPLGFLAALGTLDVVHRSGLAPTLRWTDDIEPVARLAGVDSVDQIAALVDADRLVWLDSPVLTWSPEGGGPPVDLKVSQSDLRKWIDATLIRDDRCHADLMAALLAEGPLADTGDSKPTHLHFTAGNQLFLKAVRAFVTALTAADYISAFANDREVRTELKLLGWRAGSERGHALSRRAPAAEPRSGRPGADWLAFLGLTYFPVANHAQRLVTTGFSVGWKRGAFRWPLWTRALPSDVVRSVLGDTSLGGLNNASLALRGVSRVLEAPVRRSDQGGYGSFGLPSDVLLDATPALSSRPTRATPRRTGVSRRP